MNRTTWKPDTCGCVIEYEWDPETSEAERAHTFTNAHKKCPHHESLNNTETYDTVQKENRTKNKVLKLALDNFPEIAELKSQAENMAEHKTLKDNMVYEWSFTGQGKERRLQVNFKGANLSNGQKQSMRNLTQALDVPVDVA